MAFRRLASLIEPPPRFDCLSWADRFRFLSRESSAQPGKYLSAIAPYQREPQQAVTDPRVPSVCLHWAAQLGKTEILGNIVGFFIDADPSPILMVQPTIELAEAWSKERLAPMVRDTPVLAAKMHNPRSRDAENTILHKTFIGGNVAIVGANAPTGLAGRPRRIILLDEIDRYPPSAGTEGDPCALAERRAESFWNAVIIKTSTPTVRGSSRIDVAWEQSDQREWWCPCPRCGHFQTLAWAQVQWPKDAPEQAWYECAGCQAHLLDAERVAMVRRGQWRPRHPERRARGYHLNGIATLFRHGRGYENRLHQMAAQFLESKAGGTMRLRVWVNTFLAESWEEQAERIPEGELMKRAEPYGPKLPVGILVLTAGCDVQADRLEVEVVGWGLAEESWGIRYSIIRGRPDDLATWRALDEFLQMKWEREDGLELRVIVAGIDYGAFSDDVLRWSRSRFARGIVGVKGSPTMGAPIVSALRRNNRFKAAVLTVGTDQAKALLYSRLQLPAGEPGYCHFPLESGYDAAYFSGLTAEELRVTFRRGFAVREWHKTRARNEPLDARVYAFAMLRFLNPNWTKLARGIDRKLSAPGGSAAGRIPAPASPVVSPPEATRPAMKRPAFLGGRGPGRGFAAGWRRF
jgi:phage terminase large subunit GpA-like protein